MGIEGIVGLILGLAVGALTAYLALRRRRETEAQAQRTVETERAALEERLRGREEQIDGLRRDLTTAQSEAATLREALTIESGRRAAAEEKNTRIPDLERQLAAREEVIGRLQTESGDLRTRLSEAVTKREEECRAAGEKLALLEEARQKLSDAFQALSAEALRCNNQSFLDLARQALEKHQESARGDLTARQKAIDELVAPLKASLVQVEERLRQIEQARTESAATLSEQLRTLALTQSRLEGETANLVRALRTPSVRGRWGEIQLQRVVELAGMLEYCDFVQQETAAAGGRLRPDMIVRLPSGKNVVIDAKAPLQAYLEALEAPDEAARRAKLKDHARQIRSHLQSLGTKAYWDQFEPAPEFAVLFLPGEIFFSAALEQDPALIEFGVEQKVILATPTTLIALLKAVAYGWRQERLAENAAEISRLGQALHERIATMAGHLAGLGKSLDGAVRAYNESVGSFESRVFVSARRFKEMGAGGKAEIPVLEGVERRVRTLQDGARNDDPPANGEAPPSPERPATAIPDRDGTDRRTAGDT